MNAPLDNEQTKQKAMASIRPFDKKAVQPSETRTATNDNDTCEITPEAALAFLKRDRSQDAPTPKADPRTEQLKAVLDSIPGAIAPKPKTAAGSQPKTATKPEAEVAPSDPTETATAHYFSREFAVEHGVPEAIVARFIAYKVRRAEKRKSKKAFKDGKYWFFDPITKVTERFPYFKRSAVADTLKRLETKKLIEVGNYNKLSFDRTRWYTVPQEVMDAVESGTLIRVDLDVANTHGVCAGVLIAHMRFELIEKPRKTKKPLKDIYISMSPAILAQSIPFDAKTIRRTLDKLDGEIVKHPTRKLTYTLPRLLKTEGTNPDMKRTEPDGRVTKPDENGTEPDEKWTKPDDNTHCKPLETLGNPIKKEPLQTTPRAAVLNNSPSNDPTDTNTPVAHQSAQNNAPSSTGVTGCAGNAKDDGEQSMPKLIPTCYPDNDPTISPAEKARLLRATLALHNSCNINKFIFSQADLNMAEKLFELNRDFSVSQLTDLLYECFGIPSQSGGFDKHFHARQGYKLGWFLRHLSKIAEELENTEFNGWVSLPEPVEVMTRGAARTPKTGPNRSRSIKKRAQTSS